MNRLTLNRRVLFLVTALPLMCLGTGSVTAQTPDQAQDPTAIDVIESTQGFALFEAVETTEDRTVATTRRNSRDSRATIAEPEFTLLGTSRIGDRYSAIIQHKSGEVLRVAAAANGNTAIPDYSEYSIIAVAAGSVSIRYPDDNPCAEFSDRGVSCNESSNTAELALTTSEPLAPRNSGLILAVQANEDLAIGATEEIEEGAQGEPVNPFAALRAAQGGDTNGGAADPNGANSRFSPRRISPEDVPPGQRVVSTPFGDRLVDQ